MFTPKENETKQASYFYTIQCTGTVAFVGEFRNCKANGRGRFFYPSGDEAVVGTLIDGSLQGEAAIFLESGEPNFYSSVVLGTNQYLG